MTPGAAPDTSETRQAAREPWKQKWVLKGRWQTLPGILLASGVFLAGLAALVVALNQVRTPEADLASTAQANQITPTSGASGAERGRPPNTAPTGAPSTDRDRPKWLTSNEIRGRGVGETISYYYAFNAGPGTIRVTVDGKNRGRFGRAIWVELSNIDAKELLDIGVSDTNGWDQRVVDRVELGRQQQIIMRLYLYEATIDYLVRIEGAVDLKQPAK